jgi:hypothetical protein
MASFTAEEINALQSAGNAVCQRQWMAKWRPAEFTLPEPNDLHRIREFVRIKYVQKRWFDPSVSTTTTVAVAPIAVKESTGFDAFAAVRFFHVPCLKNSFQALGQLRALEQRSAVDTRRPR